MNYIEGDTFLINTFLELTRRDKHEININGIVKIEYNYLDLLGEDTNNILQNSVSNVLEFVDEHKEYLSLENNTIYISDCEELREVLLNEYEQTREEAADYKKAVKLLINEEKKSA